MATKKSEPKTTTKTVPTKTKTVTQTQTADRVSKIKLAFLYVLIGGLILSALISITAVLIGEFNSVISKALFTTFIFVSHSLIVLAVILADKQNRIGTSLVPTVILGSIVANMVTMSLGIWEVWDSEYSWRAFTLYMLFIGVAFLLTWIKKIGIAHTTTKAATNATIGVLIALTIMLGVWLIAPDFATEPLFFRIIGALSILGITTLSVAAIFNRVAVAQKPALASTAPSEPRLHGSMLAIVITVGSIVALFWFYGFFALVAAGYDAETHNDSDNYKSKYDYSESYDQPYHYHYN